ncbi:MAG: hypothetical protein CL607_27160 [Anaerolineaceae bacterium]|nr:hypothetical protein [Anaerolineaceae bacterium]
MLSSTLSRANPIVSAEFNHQRFVIKQGRVGYLWILLAAMLVVPALLISLVTSISAFLGGFVPELGSLTLPIAWEAGTPQAFIGNLGWVLILVMAPAQYLVVTLVTMALSANSIRREKAGLTWDSLRLTGIGTRRIVWGKWWASMRALAGDHVMVTIMRMGLVTLVMTTFAPSIDMLNQIEPVSHLEKMPLLLTLTVLFGVFDAALTAAFGVLAAIPNEAAGTVVGTTVMGLRMVAMVVSFILLGLSLHLAVNVGMLDVVVVSIGGFLLYITLIIGSLAVAEKLVY